MSNKTYLMSHIRRAGYTIKKLGSNIEASKGTDKYRGSVNGVHKLIFRY